MRTEEGLLFKDRYRLVQFLGAGGFAEVWKAEDEMTHTIVVVKIFAPSASGDTEGIEIFKQEFAIVQGLVHGHLLKPQHFDTLEGHPFLVMPFCEGGSLYGMLQDFPDGMDEKRIATIMFQISGALAHLHKSKIVHQDIKPDNVLILRKGHYVLADFGVSTHFRPKNNAAERSTTVDISEVDQGPQYAFLTPEYASPEAFDGEGNTPESDLFSFGVMLYELATGKLPFQYTGEALRRGNEVPELPEPFSRELDAILATCMDPEPDKRFTALNLSGLAADYLSKGKWEVGWEDDNVTYKTDYVIGVTQKILIEDIEDDQAGNGSVSTRTVRDPDPRPKGERTSIIEEIKEAEKSKLPDTPHDPPQPSKKWLWIGLIAAVVVIGSLAGWFISNQPPPPAKLPYSYDGAKNALGLPAGQGRAVFENGIIYDGEWKDGVPHGEGIATYPDATYEGSWENGKRNGTGRLVFTSGDYAGHVYAGNFYNDIIEGDGMYKWEDNSQYRGDLTDGKIEGRGNYTDTIGNTITGEWVDGVYQNQN